MMMKYMSPVYLLSLTSLAQYMFYVHPSKVMAVKTVKID